MEQLLTQPASPDRRAAADGVAESYPTAVLVRFGAARYALPMESVAEVVAVPALTRVPGSPHWLAGVVNWRGRVLPVIDPRALLGADRNALPSSARLLVLSGDGVEAGFLAEAVAGLLEAGAAVTTAAPATASAAASSLVRGVLSDAHGPLSLLDATAVLALRAELPSVRRGR